MVNTCHIHHSWRFSSQRRQNPNTHTHTFSPQCCKYTLHENKIKAWVWKLWIGVLMLDTSLAQSSGYFDNKNSLFSPLSHRNLWLSADMSLFTEDSLPWLLTFLFRTDSHQIGKTCRGVNSCIRRNSSPCTASLRFWLKPFSDHSSKQSREIRFLQELDRRSRCYTIRPINRFWNQTASHHTAQRHYSHISSSL